MDFLGTDFTDEHGNFDYEGALDAAISQIKGLLDIAPPYDSITFEAKYFLEGPDGDYSR